MNRQPVQYLRVWSLQRGIIDPPEPVDEENNRLLNMTARLARERDGPVRHVGRNELPSEWWKQETAIEARG